MADWSLNDAVMNPLGESSTSSKKSSTSWTICGASSARPATNSQPIQRTCSPNNFESTCFVKQSEGFSVPSTFPKPSRRFRSACCSQSDWVSRWRILPILLGWQPRLPHWRPHKGMTRSCHRNPPSWPRAPKPPRRLRQAHRSRSPQSSMRCCSGSNYGPSTDESHA